MPNTPVDPIVTPELVAQHGLTPEEFERIKKILGREPNFTELGIFSVMWSEHCSYKNSRKELKKFPTKGPNILVKAGEENAGVVDIDLTLRSGRKAVREPHGDYLITIAPAGCMAGDALAGHAGNRETAVEKKNDAVAGRGIDDEEYRPACGQLPGSRVDGDIAGVGGVSGNVRHHGWGDAFGEVRRTIAATDHRGIRQPAESRHT